MAQVLQLPEESGASLADMFLQYQRLHQLQGSDGADAYEVLNNIQLHIYDLLFRVAWKSGVSVDNCGALVNEFVIHDMFEKSILRWKPGGASAKNWICNLLKFEIKGHFRAAGKERDHLAPLYITVRDADGVGTEIENPAIDASNMVEASLESNPEAKFCARALALIFRQIVRETIDEIQNERHRLYLQLNLVYGFSVYMTRDEMAEILGVPSNTLGSVLTRLLDKVRPILKERFDCAGIDTEANLMEMISRVRYEAFDRVEPELTRSVGISFLQVLRWRNLASKKEGFSGDIDPLDVDAFDMLQAVSDELEIGLGEARDHLLSAVSQIVKMDIERGETFNMFTALTDMDEVTVLALFTDQDAPPQNVRAFRELSAIARGEILYGLRERLERWSTKHPDPLGALMELCGMDGVALTGFLSGDDSISLTPDRRQAVADALGIETGAVDEMDRHDAEWRRSRESDTRGTRGGSSAGRAMIDLALKIIRGR